MQGANFHAISLITLLSSHSCHMQHTACFGTQALEEAITEQHEQERSIENEIEAYRKDIVREQIRNEQLTAVMTKLEGESGFLQTQNDSMVKKQEKLQVRLSMLTHSAAGTRNSETGRQQQQALS